MIVDDLGGTDSRLPFFCCRLELVDVVGCQGRMFVRRSTKTTLHIQPISALGGTGIIIAWERASERRTD